MKILVCKEDFKRQIESDPEFSCEIMPENIVVLDDDTFEAFMKILNTVHGPSEKLAELMHRKPIWEKKDD